MQPRHTNHLNIPFLDEFARKRRNSAFAWLHSATRQVPPVNVAVLDEKYATISVNH